MALVNCEFEKGEIIWLSQWDPQIVQTWDKKKGEKEKISFQSRHHRLIKNNKEEANCNL